MQASIAAVIWLHSAKRLVTVSWVVRRGGFHIAWQRFAQSAIAGRRIDAELKPIVRSASVLAPRFGCRCLTRSLALCSLLRERGHEAEVKIGVRREHGAFLAHAWVVLHGDVLGEQLRPGWHVLPLEEAASLYEKAATPTS